MKAYFLYLLKKRLPIFITLTVICLAFFILLNNTSPYTQEGYYSFVPNYEKGEYPKTGLLYIYMIGLFALSVIAPIIEFSFKMKKITAFQAYSFPILRRDFYLVRYFMGLLEIFIPFILSFLASTLLISISPNLYTIGYLYLYLPIAIVLGTLVYSFFVFFYSKANTILDGVVILALLLLVPFALGSVCCYFENVITGQNKVLSVDSLHPFAPVFYVTSLFENLLCHRTITGIPTIQIVVYSIYAPIMIATLVGFILTAGEFKSEDAGQKSESWFSYKIILPVSLVLISNCVAPVRSTTMSISILVFGLILTYLGYVLYLRTFKLNRKYLIVCFSVMLASITLFTICMSLGTYY